MKRMVAGAFIAVAAFVVAASVSAESRIVSVSGIVRVAPPAQPGSEQYTQAVEGQPLADGSTVITAENGRVTIEVSPGNVVRLRGESKIVVGSPRGKVTRFKLLAGTFRGIFNRLTGGDRFEVEFSSMSAIASVKGTTFDAHEGSGGASLRTIFGAIDLILKGSVQSVPQGCGMFVGQGGVVQIRPLTQSEIEEALSKKLGVDRSDIHKFIERARDSILADQDVVVQIREDDFAVGRSLRDVHGNLARVDQRLIRPDPFTIQFVNLVKRDSYAYKGKFSYAGPSGPRYDYLEGLVKFNLGLPDSVVGWPAFFSNNDNVEAVYSRVLIANGKPGDPGRDVLYRESYFQDNEPDGFTLNGVRYIPGGDTVDADGSDSGDLWATTIQGAWDAAWDTNADGRMDDEEKMMAGPATITLRLEAYAIDQDGKVLNLDRLTTGALNDPFGVVKSIAAEGIISAVGHMGEQVFNRGNIDLIVIPDLVVAIAQKYGASMAASINSGD